MWLLYAVGVIAGASAILAKADSPWWVILTTIAAVIGLVLIETAKEGAAK
jgi:hypothetical protein